MTTPGRPAGDDRGFTLLELLISLAIIGVIAASLTLLTVRTTTSARMQADRQRAVQIAVTSMEDVDLLPGSAVLAGRNRTAVLAQWRVPAVQQAYFAPPRSSTELAWSDTPVNPGLRALPTTPETVSIDGAASPYTRHWYVGVCWQPRAGGDCTVVPVQQRADMVSMYRIIVAVRWSSRDCPGGTCQHVAAVLREKVTSDPLFS